ncbi:unnamed protein product, partial [Pleuronectes platessa]
MFLDSSHHRGVDIIWQRNETHLGVIQDVKLIFAPNGFITQCPNLNRNRVSPSSHLHPDLIPLAAVFLRLFTVGRVEIGGRRRATVSVTDQYGVDFLSLVQGIMDLQELLAKMTLKLNYAESRLTQLEGCHCERTCSANSLVYRDQELWVEPENCRNCACKFPSIISPLPLARPLISCPSPPPNKCLCPRSDTGVRFQNVLNQASPFPGPLGEWTLRIVAHQAQGEVDLNGVVECRRIFCPPANCSEDSLPVHVDGTCCKKCRPKCTYMGKTFSEGRRFLSRSCRECKNGLMIKVSESCPELNCTTGEQILPDGRCCNVCRGYDFCAEGLICGENSECKNRNTRAECECKSGYASIHGDSTYCEGRTGARADTRLSVVCLPQHVVSPPQRVRHRPDFRTQREHVLKMDHSMWADILLDSRDESGCKAALCRLLLLFSAALETRSHPGQPERSRWSLLIRPVNTHRLKGSSFEPAAATV